MFRGRFDELEGQIGVREVANGFEQVPGQRRRAHDPIVSGRRDR